MDQTLVHYKYMNGSNNGCTTGVLIAAPSDCIESPRRCPANVIYPHQIVEEYALPNSGEAHL